MQIIPALHRTQSNPAKLFFGQLRGSIAASGCRIGVACDGCQNSKQTRLNLIQDYGARKGSHYFVTNQLYEVEAPTNLLVAGVNFWSYFLNSTGAANSSIFFPMRNREEADVWCGKVGTTNNAIQMNFTYLIIEAMLDAQRDF